MSLFIYVNCFKPVSFHDNISRLCKMAFCVTTDIFYLKVCTVTLPDNLILKHLSNVPFWLLWR